MTTTTITADAYWDAQDAANTGWAYRLHREGSEIDSGSLDLTDPAASYQEIAEAAAEALAGYDELIRVCVYRREDDRAWADVQSARVVDFRWAP